jgi:hypothetical protein
LRKAKKKTKKNPKNYLSTLSSSPTAGLAFVSGERDAHEPLRDHELAYLKRVSLKNENRQSLTTHSLLFNHHARH